MASGFLAGRSASNFASGRIAGLGRSFNNPRFAQNASLFRGSNFGRSFGGVGSSFGARGFNGLGTRGFGGFGNRGFGFGFGEFGGFGFRGRGFGCWGCFRGFGWGVGGGWPWWRWGWGLGWPFAWDLWDPYWYNPFGIWVGYDPYYVPYDYGYGASFNGPGSDHSDIRTPQTVTRTRSHLPSPSIDRSVVRIQSAPTRPNQAPAMRL